MRGETSSVSFRRKPDWLKIRLPRGFKAKDVVSLLNDRHLHTICTSGLCPNRAECWESRTATFMICGDICTRNCRFCNVTNRKPLPLDDREPVKIAESVKSLGLRHAVITSVDRDDLPDQGASHWVKVLKKIKELNPDVTIEALIPDFRGKTELLDLIIDIHPEVVSHNLETVRRLTPEVRSVATYEGSLAVLKYLSDNGMRTKSGIMLGLGETEKEIYETMDDLLGAGCKIMTIGQYLQPSKSHYEIKEYVHPDKFRHYEKIGLQKGFEYVESGPLVRSSYHAEKHVK